ncbi:MAG: serpin family protein, partial [Candidatus Thorarchaeota archaeon]
MSYNPRERDTIVSTESKTDERVETEGTFSIEKRVAKSNNEFAINMYQELVKLTKGNIIFSPYSIDSALSIAYGGARGTTENEIA